MNRIATFVGIPAVPDGAAGDDGSGGGVSRTASRWKGSIRAGPPIGSGRRSTLGDGVGRGAGAVAALDVTDVTAGARAAVGGALVMAAAGTGLATGAGALVAAATL